MSKGVGSKSFQKKVMRVLKDFFHSERVQSFLNDITEGEEIAVIINPERFEEFDDELQTLVSSIDKAFKYCSRTRGKKSESVALNEEIRSKLMELLEQEKSVSNQYLVSSKRSRDDREEDNDHPNKKRGSLKIKNAQLSNEDKAKLKDIVNNLTKDPEAEPFLYPVDKSVFPAYYDIIEHPMDLATWKKKINEYSSLKMAFDDLHLIWVNCCTFNAEGSDIITIAYRLGLDADAMIESHFGKSEVDSHWKKPFKGVKLPKTNASNENAVVSTTDISKDEVASSGQKLKGERKKRKSPLSMDSITVADMKELLTTLFDDDRTLLFRTPVTDAVAPGYSDIVSEPMDLGTIKKKIRGHLYGDDAQAILRDIRLVWSNCQLYNTPGSDIFNLATELDELIESKLKDITASKYVSAITPSVKKEETDVSKISKPLQENNTPSVARQVKLLEARVPSDADLGIERVEDNQLRSLPMSAVKDLLSLLKEFPEIVHFLKPIQEEDAPGYFDVIKCPIDVSTIERKCQLGSYQNKPLDFVHDVRLMWRNCLVYNLHDSAIFKAAVANTRRFEHSVRLVLAKDYEPVSPAVHLSEKMLTAEDENEENEGLLDDEDDFNENDEVDALQDNEGSNTNNIQDNDEDKEAANGTKNNRKRRTFCTFRVRKYRHVLRLICEHELISPFLELPASNSEYFSKVQHPLALFLIRKKINEYQDIPLGFLSDVKLVFDNWMSFSSPSSQMYYSARVVKNFAIDLFYQNFPSFTALKTSEDELCIAEHRSSSNTHIIIDEPHRKRHRDENADTKPTAAQSQRPPHDLSTDTSAINQDEVDLPPLFPNISKSEYKNRVNELEAFLSGEKAAQSDLFRRTAHAKAVALLKESKLPFIVAPSLYEIASYGSIIPAVSSSRKSLYPIGYEILRIMRLAVVPEEEVVTTSHEQVKDYPYVSFIFKSKVAMETETDRLLFVVELENGVIAGKGRSAKEAWTEVLGNGLPLLHCASNKLIRCRSVFNRVCVSPDCVSFLEQVPLDIVDYYSVIKSPMWLREVHNRLYEGAYDNEFDFAWDMRLIFRNCKEFNVSNSALFKQADRLSNLFEQLFVAWVINVKDASLTDVAKGEWTDWTDLRYFDTKPGSENVCKVTGKKASLSELLQCQFCEDYYLPSAVGLPASRAHSKTKWGCARCTHAFELGGNNLAGDPFTVEPETNYPAENTFVMVPELGVGWLQARRKRGGLKNLFLSPLGYEVLSKDLIDAQKEFENTVDKELLAARAKEFQDSLPGKSNAGGKTRGHYRSPAKEKKYLIRSNLNENCSSDNSTNSNIHNLIDAKYLENGRIINGKLVNFKIPSGYRLAFFCTANETEIVAAQMSGREITTTMLETFAECTVENIPEYGYFGFHLPEIRSRLEGLDGALDCKTYEFATYSEEFKEDIVATLKRKVEEAKYILEAEEKMKTILLEERWRYERAKLLPVKPTELNTEKPILAQFRKLFPVKQFEGLDIVVSVWDFLHACKSIGYINFTLADIVSSTQPCGSVHNVMQTVFDEIGCIFTDFLFQEVKNRGLFLPMTENNWQNICMVYPINTLTWSKVLEKILFLLGMPLSVEEANIILTHTCGGQCLGQFKLILLLYNHPLIDEFLQLKQTFEPLTKLRRSLINQTLSLSTAYIGVDGFVESLLETFSSVNSMGSVSEEVKAKAGAIHKWLRSLAKRMGLKSTFSKKSSTLVVDNEPGKEVGEVKETEEMQDDEPVSKEKLDDDNEDADDDHHVNLQDRLASFDVDYNQDRQYGGFSLSKYSTENNPLFVLMPHQLNVHSPMTCLEIKCRALFSLERSLFVLSSDAEFWSVTDRIHLYHTLLDLSLVSSEFRKSLNDENRRLASTYQSFRSSEMPVILSEAHTKSLSSVPRAATCSYTGISYSMVPEPSKWTILPAEYVRSDNGTNNKVMTEQEMTGTSPAATAAAAMDTILTVNNNYSNSNKRRGRDVVDGQNYVLTEALSRVIHCRRFAESDKGKYVEQMGSIVQKSFFPQFDLTFKNTMFARSQPLGYDAAGNAYWLFHVQSAMTVFPFDDKGRCLDPTDSNTSEPCILMQDPASTWYYCSSRYMASLLEHLSGNAECEQLLRLRLIEKFYIINRSLRLSTLEIKPLQHAWLQRKMHIESWLSEQTLYQGPNELHRCRMLEVMWARAAEARMHMYYAYVFKLDDDVERVSERAEREALLRKQRRIKEDSFDEVFDLHPRRGWNRLDYYTRLRQLAASTTASVLHSDPNVSKTLAAFVYHKSPFLVRNTLNVSPTDAMANDNDEDEAPKLVPRVTRSSQVEQVAMDVDKEKEGKTEKKEVQEMMDVDEDHEETVIAEVAKNEIKSNNKSPEKTIDNRPLTQHFDRKFRTTNVERNDGIAVQQHSLSHFNNSSGTTAVALDGPANVLHVNVPSYDGTHILPPRSTKAVEQLHILTGELLRIHASGKHAAQFLDLSQSGISQCLTNAKTDCYGFRWRYYIGPSIDFHEIDSYQTPVSALNIIQNDKNGIEVYRRWCAAGHDPTATVPDPTGESLALIQKTLPAGVGRQYLVDAIQRSANRLATVSAARYFRNNHDSSNNNISSASGSVLLPPPVPTVQALSAVNVSVKTVVSVNNNNNSLVGTNQNTVASGMLPLETMNPRSAIVLTASAALETDPNASYYAFPPLHLCKGNIAALPQIVTSTKHACAKLVKLKGELFNIMYSFPEKALKWPVLDEVSEELIAKAGEEAAKSTVAHQRQLPNPPSEEDIARLADKNARKIKRRMRRKLAIEQFALTVQSATTAQELLKQVLLLEAAVPISLTFVMSQRAALPVTAATVAEVAQRLYAFDRSIAYDAIANIDAAILNCPFRLRTNFVPRCHVHAFCLRYMGHTGKCQTTSQNVLLSRLPDQFQLAPPTDPFSNQRNNTYREINYNGGITHSHLQNNANAGNAVQRPVYQRPVAMANNAHLAPRVEVMPRLSQLVERMNPDIEKEQGYIPANSEIVTSVWL